MSRVVRWGPALLGAFAVLLIAWSSGVAAQQKRDNHDRRVDIVNATNMVLLSFYASNINRNSWEEDILGKNVLPPGQRVRVNIDDGTGACLFDFKAVFADGRTIEQRRVNVCQITTWTLRYGPQQQRRQQ